MFIRGISALATACALLSAPASAQDYNIEVSGTANFLPFAPGFAATVGLADQVVFLVRIEFASGVAKSPAPSSYGDAAMEYVPASAKVRLGGASFDATGTRAVRVRLVDLNDSDGGDYMSIIVDPSALPANSLPRLGQFVFTRDLNPDVLSGPTLPEDPDGFMELNPLAVYADVAAITPLSGAGASTYDIWSLRFDIEN